LKQLGDDQREGDPEHQRREDADHDHFLALRRRQPGGQRADHDRIVPREDDVDQQDFDESGNRFRCDQGGSIHCRRTLD